MEAEHEVSFAVHVAVFVMMRVHGVSSLQLPEPRGFQHFKSTVWAKTSYMERMAGECFVVGRAKEVRRTLLERYHHYSLTRAVSLYHTCGGAVPRGILLLLVEEDGRSMSSSDDDWNWRTHRGLRYVGERTHVVSVVDAIHFSVA
jgi:hypothetical protein